MTLGIQKGYSSVRNVTRGSKMLLRESKILLEGQKTFSGRSNIILAKPKFY